MRASVVCFPRACTRNWTTLSSGSSCARSTRTSSSRFPVTFSGAIARRYERRPGSGDHDGRSRWRLRMASSLSQSLRNDGQCFRHSSKSIRAVRRAWSTVSLYFAARNRSLIHPLPDLCFSGSVGVGVSPKSRKSSRDLAAPVNQVSYSVFAMTHSTSTSVDERARSLRSGPSSAGQSLSASSRTSIREGMPLGRCWLSFAEASLTARAKPCS